MRSPDHAEEVVQEVFLQVWQEARRFDPARGSVLGWVTTFAHRRAVDRVRHVTRAVERDHLATLGGVTHVADVADGSVARAEAAELRRAVDRLPARQRDALLLTFFEGCTHQQAALALRVPLGTLKTRVHTAMVSLRRSYRAAAAAA